MKCIIELYFKRQGQVIFNLLNIKFLLEKSNITRSSVFKLVVLTLILGLLACTDGSSGSDESTSEENSDINVLAKDSATESSTNTSPSNPQANLISLNSKQFQKLTIPETNTSLAGSSITISPGSLAIEGSEKSIVLIVEQGESNAAQKVQDTLALENNQIEQTKWSKQK